MNNRIRNAALEKALGGFLDEHLYEWLKGQNEGLEYERQTNLDMKNKGVDVIIASNNTLMYIAERETISREDCYDEHPTYAFEIDKIQPDNGEVLMSELFNDNMIADHYLVVWGDVRCDSHKCPGKYVRKDFNEIGKYDFTILEAMLIKKKTLIDFLGSQGWNKEKILEKAREIRQQNTQEIRVGNNFFHFFYSSDTPEKTVSVVLSKDVLKALSSRIYVMSDTGATIIKGRKQ